MQGVELKGQLRDMGRFGLPMKYVFTVVWLVATGLFAGVAVANAGGSPVGIWVDAKGRGAVEIKECGRNTLCGHIVWVSDKTERKGCGKQLLGNVRKVDASAWDNGWIIDPDDMKKYDVALEPVNARQLKVTGYMGTKFFSQDFYWTRAPANLERCDRIEEKKETIIAVQEAEPVFSGPLMAPLPDRNPNTVSFDIAGITPPAPVPAVRMGPEPAEPEEMTVGALEALSLLGLSGSEKPARPAEGFMGLKGPEQQVAYQQKTCRVVAPFVTLTFPCDK